jgi:NDP-sugar pyrophosphorylase family protein
MNAVVLVGGEGTRLRPITETVPKPLVPLMNRASLDHVLDHLARHDVHDVVLSSPYLEERFHRFIEGRHGDPAIRWITEEAPLGTGGAIVNALESVSGHEPFFALNGDILTDLDLTTMLAMHRDRAADATIALTRVADARPYGLVPTEDDGRVVEFREKPADLVPGEINAGTYVLEPSALAAWEPGRAASIEREIFPALIAGGSPVYGFVSDAYWIDLGTPEHYLRAHADILDGRVGFEPAYPAPLVAEGAEVDARARLGRHVVVGPGAAVRSGARVDESVLHERAVVGERAVVSGSILGPGSNVGANARVHACVLGAAASVPQGAVLDGERLSAGGVATSGESRGPGQPMG